jgi:hypothetical protein
LRYISFCLVKFAYDDIITEQNPFSFQDDVDRLLEDGSLDDNVESFLSQDDMDPRDNLGRCMDASKGVVLFPCTCFDFDLSL